MMATVLVPDAVRMLLLGRMGRVVHNDHDHHEQPGDDGQDLVPEKAVL